jgi:hypothetical protein
VTSRVDVIVNESLLFCFSLHRYHPGISLHKFPFLFFPLLHLLGNFPFPSLPRCCISYTTFPFPHSFVAIVPMQISLSPIPPMLQLTLTAYESCPSLHLKDDTTL